ncbi:uncharacterized protein LOC108677238 [Hyalella azteca]|uniref:Uncharacterized protein LOC108677238 n=1 Tax=Hyalella azteca TaxID=294128 RepID=A0A8B7P4E9_HYAAZ|nr:uncharacterized protein LOC108677238 [Hyalella azteca]
MLSSQFYPDDDFDLDDGLDFGQFEYNNQPFQRLSHHDSRHHTDNYQRNDGHFARDQLNRGSFYHQDNTYAAQYNENIVMKPRPEYYDIPFETRDRFDNRNSYRETDWSAHRFRESRPAQSSGLMEGNYRKPHSDHFRREPKRRSWRDSGFDDFETRSYRPPTAATSRSTHGRSGRKHGVPKKEKHRRFPSPDAKTPVIPLPDYDGADTGANYVPEPDY